MPGWGAGRAAPAPARSAQPAPNPSRPAAGARRESSAAAARPKTARSAGASRAWAESGARLGRPVRVRGDPAGTPWRRHGRAPAGGRGLNPSARAVRRGLPCRRPRPIQHSVTRNQERYTFSMASRLRIPFGSQWPRPIRRGHQAKPRYLGCQWPRVAAPDPVVACGLRTLSQHACVAAAAAAMAAGRSGREPAPGRGLLERRVLRRRRRRRRASFAAC